MRGRGAGDRAGLGRGGEGGEGGRVLAIPREAEAHRRERAHVRRGGPDQLEQQRLGLLVAHARHAPGRGDGDGVAREDLGRALLRGEHGLEARQQGRIAERAHRDHGAHAEALVGGPGGEVVERGAGALVLDVGQDLDGDLLLRLLVVGERVESGLTAREPIRASSARALAAPGIAARRA